DAKTDAKTEKKTETDATRSDAAILSEATATPKGVEAVAAMQMERSSHVSQQLEQLTAKMTDAEATDAQIAEASEQHDALMDRESKMIALEEQLMQQYAHVVVTVDDAQQYTVNVHAPSLSKTEAANMLTAAIEQLHAAPQNVAVKLIR
ncbi:MAG: SpoIIIAH-like family protein, partial [Paenibacillaceae bacterium]|nr:SpoIIIAH-like family protein [Paenibacillaceae bacterium]